MRRRRCCCSPRESLVGRETHLHRRRRSRGLEGRHGHEGQKCRSPGQGSPSSAKLPAVETTSIFRIRWEVLMMSVTDLGIWCYPARCRCIPSPGGHTYRSSQRKSALPSRSSAHAAMGHRTLTRTHPLKSAILALSKGHTVYPILSSEHTYVYQIKRLIPQFLHLTSLRTQPQFDQWIHGTMANKRCRAFPEVCMFCRQLQRRFGNQRHPGRNMKTIVGKGLKSA